MMLSQVPKDGHHDQFSKYLIKDYFTDVTLVSDDLQKFPAHKIILSASSPVFESLLLACPKINGSHTILPLRGYFGYQIQGLLNFIYSRSTDNNVPDNGLIHLIEEFMIKGYDKSIEPLHKVKEFNLDTNLKKIREEFRILNTNNIIINSVKPLDHESKNYIEQDNKMSNKSGQVRNFKENDDKMRLEGVDSRESENKPSTIIFEGTECPIVNDDDESNALGGAEKHHRQYKQDEMVKIISDRISFECALCDSFYDAKNLLLMHEKSYHKLEGEKFNCKICKKEFKNLTRLKVHYDSIHGEQRFQCTKCSFKSGKKDFVYDHFQCHKDATLSCDFCEKKFVRNNELKVHKQIHQQDKERRTWKCNVCDQYYPSKFSLYQHKEIVHNLVRYACAMCPFQASSKYYLKTHEEGFHQGITFDCKMCDYKAKIQSALKKHIRVEHEGFRLSCEECPNQYRTLWELLKHKTRKHGHENTKKRKRNKVIYK